MNTEEIFEELKKASNNIDQSVMSVHTLDMDSSPQFCKILDDLEAKVEHGGKFVHAAVSLFEVVSSMPHADQLKSMLGAFIHHAITGKPIGIEMEEFAQAVDRCQELISQKRAELIREIVKKSMLSKLEAAAKQPAAGPN